MHNFGLTPKSKLILKVYHKMQEFWIWLKTKVSAANFSFGSKAKMSQIAPKIFQTFYQISSRLLFTFQHVKNLEGTFFILACYHPFWLLTWSKIKNFDLNHKSQNDNFQKVFDLRFMKKVIFLIFWTCQKSKWVLTCQNEKSAVQIFYVLETTW